MKGAQFGVALVLVGDEVLLAHRGVVGIAQRREEVRVLERQPDLAFVLALALLQAADEVLGHAVELLRRQPHAAGLLVQRLFELNLEVGEAVLDVLEAVTLFTGRDAKAVANVGLVLLLQKQLGLGVELLALFQHGIDQGENVFSHGRLDRVIAPHFGGRAGRLAKAVIGGDVLVESIHLHLEVQIVVVEGSRQDDVLERGLLLGDCSDDIVLDLFRCGNLAKVSTAQAGNQKPT